MRDKTSKPDFPGLRLTAEDRQALKAKTEGRQRLSSRTWGRIRILELLDRGWNLQDTAAAVGTYPREVRRVGWRFLERGLEAALSDDPRPKPERKLDARKEAAIVAMVCSSPPAGQSRWTVALIARETVKRGIVEKVGAETIRRTLLRHELKPWREKNVVRPQAGPAVRRPDGGRPEPVGAAGD